MDRCTEFPTTLSPRPCKINDLLSLAGSHMQCSMVLLGIATPCGCLCTFGESDMRKFQSCALGGGSLNAYEQWQDCKKHDQTCGNGGVVVVHGRRLRAA